MKKIFFVLVIIFGIGLDSGAFSSLPPLENKAAQESQKDKNENPTSSSANLGTQSIKIAAGKLYEKPDTASKVVVELENGKEVTLIRQEGEWYIVKLSDNRLAWAHQSLFQEQNLIPGIVKAVDDTKEKTEPIPKAPSQPPPQPKTENSLTIKVDRARVRENPSFDAKVNFGLKQDETVSLLDSKGEWYFIQRNDGKTGWAHQSLFYPISKPVETPLEKPLPGEIPAEIGGITEVKDIRFETGSDGEEKVVFILNGFHPPESFALEDGVPKVVCDFKDARLAEGIGKQIPVSGTLIQKIRVGIHEGSTKKVRVVMDLVPHKDYEVEQVFFRKDNTYVLKFKPGVKR